MTACPKPPKRERRPRAHNSTLPVPTNPLRGGSQLRAVSARKAAAAVESGQPILSTLRRSERRMSFRSEKTAAEMRKYGPEVEVFLADHKWCEFPGGCGRRSTVVHHRYGRNGKRLRDQNYWAASCDEHNQYAEDETGAARESKWLLDVNGDPAIAARFSRKNFAQSSTFQETNS